MDKDITIKSLEQIWPLQAELNARTGFDTQGLGRQLAEALERGALESEGGLRAQVGRVIKNYLDALVGSWKHWYREAKEGRQYELRDIQNARVEAIDMLFFWISLCQLLGLEPEDVYRLYESKLTINHKRQDENRSQAEHAGHESENRSVL